MLLVRKHYKKIAGILWAAIFLFLVLFLVRYLSVHDMTFREWLFMTREDMKEVLMDNMIVAPLIYIIIYTLRPLVFFPTSILTPLSSAVFGPLLGWIYTYIGENIAASVAFFVARYLGGDVVSRFKRLERIDTELQEHGLRTVIFLRLVPVFPFDAVNFGLGLTSVSWRQYALGTAIGVIPGLTAYIFLGASLFSGMYIIPTILGFIILSLLASLLRKRNKAVIKKLL